MIFGEFQLYVKMAATKIKGLDSFVKNMKGLENKIDKVIKDTLLEYANRILSESMSKLGNSAIASTFHLEVSENGYRVTIYTDNEIAAYIEFGTGDYAANYLSGQPDEVTDQAIKFFVTGEGTMPANPYLFPTYFKYKEEIIIEIDRRVQKLLDKVA